MHLRAVNPDQPCKTLLDYLREVNRIRKAWREEANTRDSRSELWFRGQRFAKWDLRPRIYRDEYADADEAEIRLAFQGNGLQLAPTIVNRSEWEWYFLMQHYGAPTRLLDWTGNPLAALYFAIADDRATGNSHAAVWLLDPWRWNELHNAGLWGPALPDWDEPRPYLPRLQDACDGKQVRKRWPIAIEPPSIDRRLASQTGRFLLFGKKKDLIEAANRTDSARRGKKKASRLIQIIVARKWLESIRRELDDVGINQHILFPDLQGLGTHLSWEWSSKGKHH